MRAYSRIALLAVVIAIAPVLAGCADGGDFDMDKLDIFGFNKKKPLPGHRVDLFPNGVPGVTQGIPPQYMQGYQEKQEQQADAASAAAEAGGAANKTAMGAPDQKSAAVRAEKPKQVVERKPKPKHKRVVKRKAKPKARAAAQAVSKPAPQPAAETARQSSWPSPSSASPPSGQGAWPAPTPAKPSQSAWPDGSTPPQQQNSPWPTPPASGGFSH